MYRVIVRFACISDKNFGNLDFQIMNENDNLFEYLHMSIVKYYADKKPLNDDLITSLETLGFRVGYGLIERLVLDNLRSNDSVAIMKFICKEFWIMIYSKQVDNLRTNNSVFAYYFKSYVGNRFSIVHSGEKKICLNLTNYKQIESFVLSRFDSRFLMNQNQ